MDSHSRLPSYPGFHEVQDLPVAAVVVAVAPVVEPAQLALAQVVVFSPGIPQAAALPVEPRSVVVLPLVAVQSVDPAVVEVVPQSLPVVLLLGYRSYQALTPLS